VHQINLGVLDVLLPAIITCPAALKFIEGDLADKTNHFGFVGSNGIQRAPYACSLFTSGQLCHVYRGPIHKVHKI